MERKSLGRTLYNAGLPALYTGGTLAVAKLISPGVSWVTIPAAAVGAFLGYLIAQWLRGKIWRSRS